MTEAFEREMIDRLARMETKQDAIRSDLKSMNARLCDGDERMDSMDKRLSSVEQAINDPDTGLAATRKKVDDVQKQAYAVGGAASLLSILGFSGGWTWLSQLFGK
jgi:predicted  nucleic acid-binding Zn-ribbon protein